MGITINIRGSGDMAMSTYDPNKDGVIALAQTQAKNVATGTYAGDGTVNKAIAHGLGSIPKNVFISGSDGYVGQISNEAPTKLMVCSATTDEENTVTTMSTTNFYVGKIASPENALNKIGITYRWVAVV